MGINLKTPKDDLYYVDSILKRCVVLSNNQQDVIYNYLISSVEVNSLLNSCKNVPDAISSVNIKTFWHRLDNQQKDRFTKMFSISPELSINQFIFPWVGLMKTESVYQTSFQASIKIKAEY